MPGADVADDDQQPVATAVADDRGGTLHRQKLAGFRAAFQVAGDTASFLEHGVQEAARLVEIVGVQPRHRCALKLVGRITQHLPRPGVEIHDGPVLRIENEYALVGPRVDLRQPLLGVAQRFLQTLVRCTLNAAQQLRRVTGFLHVGEHTEIHRRLGGVEGSVGGVDDDLELAVDAEQRGHQIGAAYTREPLVDDGGGETAGGHQRQGVVTVGADHRLVALV